MVERVRHRAARVLVAGVVGLLIVGSACSEEEPTDYTAAHREAFLAACSRPLDDPRLLSDVCGCVYDRIEDEVPFAEFQAMSEGLAASTSTSSGAGTAPEPDGGATGSSAITAQLPGDVARLVADCFTDEADL